MGGGGKRKHGIDTTRVVEWHHSSDVTAVPLRHSLEDFICSREADVVVVDVSSTEKNEGRRIGLVACELYEHFDIALVDRSDVMEGASSDDMNSR